jgi:predicted enzyme related to lactoylglutathione lyase
MITYTGYLIVVDEMEPVRHFYADVMGQKLKIDSPEYVVFEGEFCLFLKRNFLPILKDEQHYPIRYRGNNGELYFESNDIEADEARLRAAGTEFLHPIQEQPWAQRVMRFYDPIGTLIEVGEDMSIVIRRLQSQGMSLEQVSQRIGFSVPMIEEILSKSK